MFVDVSPDTLVIALLKLASAIGSLEPVLKILAQFWRKLQLKVQAALTFYTCLPVSSAQLLDFRGVAALAPAVGVAIGSLLGIEDWSLELLQVEPLLRACLVILGGVLITGGLHLDGAMDAADGLAVTDKERRLEVMADSATGAYGVMAAIAIILLKISALMAFTQFKVPMLVSVAAWGRWGQLSAISQYPYLKASGKGKFHQADIHDWQVWLVGVMLSGVSLVIGLSFNQLNLAMFTAIAGAGIGWGVGAWFNHQLGGHTGDTYGATVEWTEALMLVAIAVSGLAH